MYISLGNVWHNELVLYYTSTTEGSLLQLIILITAYITDDLNSQQKRSASGYFVLQTNSC